MSGQCTHNSQLNVYKLYNFFLPNFQLYHNMLYLYIIAFHPRQALPVSNARHETDECTT